MELAFGEPGSDDYITIALKLTDWHSTNLDFSTSLGDHVLPALQTGAGHAFAEAAFFEKFPLELADLLVEEKGGLVDPPSLKLRRDKSVTSEVA